MKKIFLVNDNTELIKIALWLTDPSTYQHRIVKRGYGVTQGWEWKKHGRNALFVWFRERLPLRQFLSDTLGGRQVYAIELRDDCWLGKAGEQVIIAY